MIIGSLPVLLVLEPLALKYVPISVHELPETVLFVVEPLTLINRPIRPFLHAIAVPLFPSPLACV